MKGEDMKMINAFNNYVSSISIVKDGLASGATTEEIEELIKVIGTKNTEEIVELLSLANGEKSTSNVATLAGLYFLSSERIKNEVEYFKNCGIEFTAIGTNAIVEEDNGKRQWIPFAHDGSRCFFAVDLSPAKTGKVGQVITIDLDYDQCYLLANSLCEMFDKFTNWYSEGILTIAEEDGENYISGNGCHIFDRFDELLVSKVENGCLVEVTDNYWKEFYAKKIIEQDEKTYIDRAVLSGEKRVLIKAKELSLDIFQYMDNLKEVILHDCKVKNVSGLAKAPELTKLIFARCEMIDCDLAELVEAPKLKILSLNVMSGKGLEKLSTINTLKELNVRAVTDIDEKTIASFVKIQNLSIETMDITDVSFLSNMKGLKILNLYSLAVDNLDFLSSLSKLSEFTLREKAKDETGLVAIKNLSKLTSFIYPVTDITLYKDCMKLESVGFAPEVKHRDNFDVFEGSNIHSFTVCGKAEMHELKAIATKMEKYTFIQSYGGIG